MKQAHVVAAAALLAVWLAAAPAQAQVRPEIGRPLQQASDMLRAGKAKEALAKVREAEAVGGKTAAESLTIDRMKAAAAMRAGDLATGIQALEAIHPRSGGAEAGQIAEQLASAYAQQRNNARASEWMNKAIAAGNNSASIKQLQAYLLGASGDYGAIARDAAAAVNAAEVAGRRADEGDLLRLADAQMRTGNTAGQVHTLEKLLLGYPKKDYWNAYLGRLPRKPNFGDRFALDVLRLKLATGTLSRTEDYMEMAQLSLQQGLAAEAVRVIDAGFKSGALGAGAEAERHKRLRDLATKKEQELKGSIAEQAKEAETLPAGDDMVKLGFSYASMGDTERGIALIEAGVKKGNLKRPEDAKLRLGMAQLMSGKARPKALQTLRSVTGTDGAADIARLWTVVPSN